MICERGRCGDLVSSKGAWLLWGLPTFAIIATAFTSWLRLYVWIASFLLMGAACLINARGCRRRHCYVTGPLFVLAAVATAVDAVGFARIDNALIVLVALLGTAAGYASSRCGASTSALLSHHRDHVGADGDN